MVKKKKVHGQLANPQHISNIMQLFWSALTLVLLHKLLLYLHSQTGMEEGNEKRTGHAWVNLESSNRKHIHECEYVWADANVLVHYVFLCFLWMSPLLQLQWSGEVGGGCVTVCVCTCAFGSLYEPLRPWMWAHSEMTLHDITSDIWFVLAQKASWQLAAVSRLVWKNLTCKQQLCAIFNYSNRHGCLTLTKDNIPASLDPSPVWIQNQQIHRGFHIHCPPLRLHTPWK